MRVEISVVKLQKYGATHSADVVELAERPLGGVSAVLADGQGGVEIAAAAARKIAGSIREGKTDDAAFKAAHDALFAERGGRASCALTMIGIDSASDTVSICKNSSSPVFVVTPDYETVYDDEANPVGLYRHTKPFSCELPLENAMTFAFFSDGVLLAGKKSGKKLDSAYILKIIAENKAHEVDFIAGTVLEYAAGLDEGRPNDDMTVLVVGICAEESASDIWRAGYSCPV